MRLLIDLMRRNLVKIVVIVDDRHGKRCRR